MKGMYRDIIQCLAASTGCERQGLAQQLNISLDKLDNALQALLQSGAPLLMEAGKIALLHPIDLLDDARLETFSKRHGVPISLATIVPSTNDVIKEIANPAKLCFSVAEYQSSGKGQQGRRWHSPFAENICFSLRWQFAGRMTDLSGLSLVAGISLLAALDGLAWADELTLKWPNDLMLGQKKCGGVLTEVVTAKQGCDVVIGVGLNVNTVFPEDSAFVSLCQRQGKPYDRSTLLLGIMEHLLADLKLFERNGFEAFYQRWQPCDFLKGRQVRVSRNQESVLAKACGVDKRGRLLIEQTPGALTTCESGSVEWDFV